MSGLTKIQRLEARIDMNFLSDIATPASTLLHSHIRRFSSANNLLR